MTVRSDSTGVRKSKYRVVKIDQPVASTLYQLRDPSSSIFTAISERNPKHGGGDSTSDPPLSPINSGVCQHKYLSHRALGVWRKI